MPKELTSAYLQGVSRYRQGSHDSLCVYYSASNLLAALIPTLRGTFGLHSFGVGKSLAKSDEPLLQATAERTKQPVPEALLKWFFSGQRIEHVVEAMNLVAGRHFEGRPSWQTQFNYQRRSMVAGTRAEIVANINIGLPVLVGWQSSDLGDHCVLVDGYRQENGGRIWFSLADPGGDSEIEWETLKKLRVGQLDVCTVDRHLGPRPDKVVTKFTGGHRKSTNFFRWESKGGGSYVNVADAFPGGV